MPKSKNPIILIIDKSTPETPGLIAFLEQKKLLVLHAEGLGEARKILRSEAVHAIIINTDLGKVDYGKLMYWMREEELLYGIAVVISAEGGNMNTVQEAIKWNVDGFVQKPFINDDVYSKLKKVLVPTYVLQKITKERQVIEEDLNKQKETQDFIIHKLRNEISRRQNKIVDMQKDIKRLDIFVSSGKYVNRKEKTTAESKLYRLRLGIEQLRSSIKTIEEKMQDVYQTHNEHKSKQAEKITVLNRKIHSISKS